MKVISSTKSLHRKKLKERKEGKYKKSVFKDLEIKHKMINLCSLESILRILRIVCGL